MPSKTTTAAEVAEHANLAAALAAFQAEMPTVHKGKTAKIAGSNGRSGYSYDYADLADVAKAAHPVLARHGLSFAARPSHVDGLGFVLVGVLRHASGETDEGVLPIQGRTAQEIGSSLTYNRRYLLGCMTGIVTDEDDDGAAANNARDARPQAQPVAQAPAAEQAGGTRQQGQQAPAPQGQPDGAVVRAQTIAATRATTLDALQQTWQQAVASGTFGSSIVDPDAGDRDAPPITLGEFLMRKRAELEAAA